MAALKDTLISYSHRENMAEDHDENLIGKFPKLQHQLKVQLLQVSYAKVRALVRTK